MARTATSKSGGAGGGTDLGTRIRTLRRIQKRTLQEVADRCGFTVSLLSKIETGSCNPPVATLLKIAAALGVRLGELADPDAERRTVFLSAREQARSAPPFTDKGYAFHMLAGGRANKLMQPILFTAERGRIVAGPMRHGGEEFVFVLEGSMRYRVGNTIYELGPGDGLYFDAEEEHDLDPTSKVVRYLAVFCERSPSAGPAPSSS